MGAISTPPKPLSAKVSRCHFNSCSLTALPIHHQRVQGFISLVTSGQALTSRSCGDEQPPQKNSTRKKTGNKNFQLMHFISIFFRCIINNLLKTAHHFRPVAPL